MVKSKHKLIDLSTSVKAEAFFCSIKRISFDELKRMSIQEIDTLHSKLPVDYITSSEPTKIEPKLDYKNYFKNKQFEYYEQLKSIKVEKKTNTINKRKKFHKQAIQNLANRITQNDTFEIFCKQFEASLNSEMKSLNLKLFDFTKKERQRLYDFSLNSSKKSFGF